MLIVAARYGFSTHAQAEQPPQPLWEIDLAKFGFQGRPPVQLGPEDHWGFSTYQQGVVFTEPNVVVAFFVTHENPPGGPAQRKALATDTYRLVAVWLTASSGELIKRLEWQIPTFSDYIPLPHFFAATKGRFLVAVGTSLFLYSPDYRVLARYDADNELNPTVSPAGDTVLMHESRQVEGQGVSYYRLLDTERLETKESWQESSAVHSNYALWGNQLTWLESRSIYVKTPRTEPRRLAESKAGFCGSWDFVSQETIAAVDCSGEEKLVLVATDGRIIQGLELGLEQINGPIVASQNGQRFAVPSHEWGSGRNVNPRKLIARVYGGSIEAPLLVLDVSRHYGTGENFGTPYGDTRFGWGGLALSPDGTLLMVKSGPIVQMYRVPDASESTKQEQPVQPIVSATPGDPLRKVSSPSPLVQQALAWLPAVTETVIGAHGPFTIPELKTEETAPTERSDAEAMETFQHLPLALFAVEKGLLWKHLKGQKVLAAIEGARHFRSPQGLGMLPYDGCDIAIFESDVTEQANAFGRDTLGIALKSEVLEGYNVTVLQERLENDIWTTFITFPKPNIAVAASDEKYLREVLARMNGKSGQRALPESLPEWRYVNAQAALWAIRHYVKTGADHDPTSPFGGKKSANMPDDQAIGMAFDFHPAKSKTATVTYLSGDKDALKNVEKNLFPLGNEPGAKALNIQYRQVSPGVVQATFQLSRVESMEIFAFMLMAWLGHAVYV